MKVSQITSPSFLFIAFSVVVTQDPFSLCDMGSLHTHLQVTEHRAQSMGGRAAGRSRLGRSQAAWDSGSDIPWARHQKFHSLHFHC